jgi:hypothetical protein
MFYISILLSGVFLFPIGTGNKSTLSVLGELAGNLFLPVSYQ